MDTPTHIQQKRSEPNIIAGFRITTHLLWRVIVIRGIICSKVEQTKKTGPAKQGQQAVTLCNNPSFFLVSCYHKTKLGVILWAKPHEPLPIDHKLCTPLKTFHWHYAITSCTTKALPSGLQNQRQISSSPSKLNQFHDISW
jgi:hypothetical protein